MYHMVEVTGSAEGWNIAYYFFTACRWVVVGRLGPWALGEGVCARPQGASSGAAAKRLGG